MSPHRKRPLFLLRVGRDYWRRQGWVLILIVAPYPDDEQVDGALTRALINMEIRASWSWPFLQFDCYLPRRDRSRRRSKRAG